MWTSVVFPYCVQCCVITAQVDRAPSSPWSHGPWRPGELWLTYHPQSNGLLERWHRPLKVVLMARCDSTEWVFFHLPWVLSRLRTMLHEGCDTSAAEAVQGQPLVVPGEFLPPARWVAKRFVPASITWNNRSQNTYIPPGLQESTHVFVRHDHVRPALSLPYQGPFQVIQQQSYHDRSQQEA